MSPRAGSRVELWPCCSTQHFCADQGLAPEFQPRREHTYLCYTTPKTQARPLSGLFVCRPLGTPLGGPKFVAVRPTESEAPSRNARRDEVLLHHLHAPSKRLSAPDGRPCCARAARGNLGDNVVALHTNQDYDDS
jgi:hypothetical protein